MTDTIEITHKQLLDAAAVIGNIIECNNQYTRLLAERAHEAGDAIDDMTIGQLVELIEETTIEFNGGWT